MAPNELEHTAAVSESCAITIMASRECPSCFESEDDGAIFAGDEILLGVSGDCVGDLCYACSKAFPAAAKAKAKAAEEAKAVAVKAKANAKAKAEAKAKADAKICSTSGTSTMHSRHANSFVTCTG